VAVHAGGQEPLRVRFVDSDLDIKGGLCVASELLLSFGLLNEDLQEAGVPGYKLHDVVLPVVDDVDVSKVELPMPKLSSQLSAVEVVREVDPAALFVEDSGFE
jgi:hypothetical protein